MCVCAHTYTSTKPPTALTPAKIEKYTRHNPYLCSSWGASERGNELGKEGDIQTAQPEAVFLVRVETDAATGAMYNALGPVVMVSAGQLHSGEVTDDCTVWTCGANSEGQLGHGANTRHSLVPVRLGMMQHFARSPAVMVASGAQHTLVLPVTARGHIWSSGESSHGATGLMVGHCIVER